MFEKRLSTYWPRNSLQPPQNSGDPSDVTITGKVTNIHTFFDPLVNVMRRSGFISTHEDDDSLTTCKKGGHGFLYFLRTVYLTAVWIWTIGMSINIFYQAISTSGHVADDTNTPNTIIQLLEESPYSFITLRCAVILTIFMAHSSKLLEAVHECAELQSRILVSGGKISFDNFRNRPVFFAVTTIVVILLWEALEWSVWFLTTGLYSEWDLIPFPFTILQWHYAVCWSLFTTIPFIFSQLALCFPVLFAYVLRKFCRFINKELVALAKLAKNAEADNDEVAQQLAAKRLTALRTAHCDISKTFHKVDNAVTGLLLVQFMADVVVLFGFLGLLVNSKNKHPAIPDIEWSFYIISSLVWFFFFLFHFSFPVIHMAEEAERTHHLVHALTFSSPKLFKERFDDLRIFLNELRGHTLVFTGGHFYYLNRHYIVTCIAVITSYVTILSEILDRYYSTEHIKQTISNIATMVLNVSDLTAVEHPKPTNPHAVAKH